MTSKKVTILLVIMYGMAYINGWGTVWKVIVGLVAGLDLFTIGIEVGNIR